MRLVRVQKQGLATGVIGAIGACAIGACDWCVCRNKVRLVLLARVQKQGLATGVIGAIGEANHCNGVQLVRLVSVQKQGLATGVIAPIH